MLDPADYRNEDVQDQLPPHADYYDRERIGSHYGQFKCGGCNWEVSFLYVLAESEEEARRLYLGGDAGLCDSCIADILVNGVYEVSLRTTEGE